MIAYAITDPQTLSFQTLEDDIKRFATKADMIVYRDKLNSNYIKDAKLFMIEAKKYSFDKVLLHTDYNLAYKLKADGVHLKSTQFNDIEKAKALGLFIIISTHTLEDALEAQILGANMITLSPIFNSPNKGEPIALKALNHVVSLLSIPVIALGGIISEEQIDSCERNGAKGFASIRYFG